MWLIDLTGRQLTRYRDPWDAGYVRADRPTLGAPIGVGALSSVRVDLSALFAGG